MSTRLLSARLLLLALLTVPLAGVASDSNVDAIRKLQTAQAAAWNKHDADAYAALFTSDGDVVNVLGWWWRGRDQIQRKLSDGFAFVFRDSRLTITDVDVRIRQDPRPQTDGPRRGSHPR
jgi:SnoaL-like domain